MISASIVILCSSLCVSLKFPLHIKSTVVVYQFAKAAATKYHKLSDVNNKIALPFSFGD